MSCRIDLDLDKPIKWKQVKGILKLLYEYGGSYNVRVYETNRGLHIIADAPPWYRWYLDDNTRYDIDLKVKKLRNNVLFNFKLYGGVRGWKMGREKPVRREVLESLLPD